MPDREQVINGLTAIEDEAYDRWVHRQYIEDPLITLIRDNVPDALAMLKAKPSSGEWIWDRPHHFRCSVCGNVGGVTATLWKYCPYCGSLMFLSEVEREKEWNVDG